MKQLEVIESCDGCGACCMSMGLPPGYTHLLRCLENVMVTPDEADESLFLCKHYHPEEFDRVNNLPEELKREILKRSEPGKPDWDGEICVWLDMNTRKCKHYDIRPSVCRKAVEIGDDGCRSWRKEYADEI